MRSKRVRCWRWNWIKYRSYDFGGNCWSYWLSRSWCTGNGILGRSSRGKKRRSMVSVSGRMFFSPVHCLTRNPMTRTAPQFGFWLVLRPMSCGDDPVRFVSSCSSRRAASCAVSLSSMKPPGRVHSPLQGWTARWTKRSSSLLRWTKQHAAGTGFL